MDFPIIKWITGTTLFKPLVTNIVASPMNSNKYCTFVTACFMVPLVVQFVYINKYYLFRTDTNFIHERVLNMPLPEERIYTTDDIYALPDGERAELINGQIYYMAPPSRTHQRIVGKLYTLISNYIDSKNGPCEVDISPFAVFLNEDNKNYVEPDISVICDKSKLTDKGCSGAPDWIIEIVFPGSRRMDYYTKLLKYSSSNVREYWIVDPDKSRIIVYDLEHEDMNEYTFADTVKVCIYPDLSINFNNIDIR